MIIDMDAEFLKWGLKISCTKTVIACLNCDQILSTPFLLRGKPIPHIPNQQTHTVKFLGSLLDFRSADSTPDMWRRVNLAQAVVQRLSKSVWRLTGTSTRAKIKTFNSMVLPVLLHGCETWTLSDASIQQLEGFVCRSLRTLLGLSWKHKVSYDEIRHRCGMCTRGSATWHLRYRQLRWFGHVMRMKTDALPIQVMCGAPPDCHRPQRKPPLRWIDRIYSYLTQLEVSTKDPIVLRSRALNRQKWREIIRKPFNCVLCAAKQAADATTPSSATNPSRVQPNRKAPWRGQQPWFYCTTDAGPQYGCSTSGRPKKRPRLDPNFDYSTSLSAHRDHSHPAASRKRSASHINPQSTQGTKKKRTS
jgi:hypothetical protein